LKPSLLGFLQFFQVGLLFAQKALREYPAFVRRKYLSANQCNGAALVVFANSFARTRSSNAATDDEIIAPNHMRNSHDNFSAAAPTS